MLHDVRHIIGESVSEPHTSELNGGISLIGASLSEPHSREFNGDFCNRVTGRVTVRPSELLRMLKKNTCVIGASGRVTGRRSVNAS